MSRSKKLLYSITIFFMIFYLVWRALFTIPFHDSWFSAIFGLLLFLSEVISAFTAAILIWSKQKEEKIEEPKIEGVDWPEVDIFIATHNESVDLLYKTVNACVHMAYPDKEKVHIYLSDDTNRSEVHDLAKKFSIGYIGLDNNMHAKSGNLNNALEKTISPLVVTFDADMIPYSNFLIKTVPYFMEENKNKKPLGFVQSPQSFYNADLFQYNFFSEFSIPNEQDYFSREVNVLNNAHDSAIYTGSNTVLLRQAIIDAGGFPTDTVTEDFELGAMINIQGYRSISTIEPLASGITPTNIPEMLKQRIRWAQGVVRSVHNLKILTNKNLSWAQKMVFLNSYFYWWSFFRRLLYILAPIIYTVFDTRVVVANIWQLFLFWLPGYVLLQLTKKDVSSDIRTESWGEIQETILAPYLVLPVFLETIGFKTKKFKVTNKNSIQSRTSSWYALPHATLLILLLIGFFKFNFGKYGSEIFYGSIVSFWLLAHSFNLSFAVLFFMGRPIYRNKERFAREIPLTLNYRNQTKSLKSFDISENGLSFSSNEPLYLPIGTNLDFNISKGEYFTNLKGKVVRINSNKNQWFYGLELEALNESDLCQYLQIIYDGFNQKLPLTRDPWITPFDRLINIISQRLNLLQKHEIPSNNLPKVDININLVLDSFQVELNYFDFETISFLSFESLVSYTRLNLKIDDIIFNLAFENKHYENLYVYRVTNLDEILDSKHFNTIIHDWTQNNKKLGGNYVINFVKN